MSPKQARLIRTVLHQFFIYTHSASGCKTDAILLWRRAAGSGSINVCFCCFDAWVAVQVRHRVQKVTFCCFARRVQWPRMLHKAVFLCYFETSCDATRIEQSLRVLRSLLRVDRDGRLARPCHRRFTSRRREEPTLWRGAIIMTAIISMY